MAKHTEMPCLSTLKPTDLLGKTIFIRVDFNVPMVATKKGYRVLDDTRMRRFLDTTFKKIHELTDGNCRIIIGSHLGRPHKRKDHAGWDGIFNLQYVSSHFDTLIRQLYEDTYSIFPPEITDHNLKNSLDICLRHQLPLGGIKFLPNLRYLLDPDNTDVFRDEFIEELGKVSDVFINCAFGCSHRVSKSIRMLPRLMRQDGKLAVAGILLNEEIHQLGEFGQRVLEHPERTAVVAGGTKIADKIGILKAFVESRIGLIFIGGRMVNAFLMAQDMKDKIPDLNLENLPKKMWENKNEEERQDLLKEVKFAAEIIELAGKNGVSLIFPDDYKVTQDFQETQYVIKKAPDLNRDFQLDLGPETIENYYKTVLREGQIQNIFWNGPLGAYDHPKCDHYTEGSVKLAKILFAAAISDNNMKVVVGGGDSAAVLNMLEAKELQELIKKQLFNQLNETVNRNLISFDFQSNDTYTLSNYFTRNFFVSTGGGASLEFLEKFMSQKNNCDIASYLPGTSILMELTCSA